MQHLQWSLPIDIDLGLILHCRESSELDNTKRLNPSTDGIQINVVVQTGSSAANYNVSLSRMQSQTLYRVFVNTPAFNCHIYRLDLWLRKTADLSNRKIKYENSVVLQEALEPHHIHQIGGK